MSYVSFSTKSENKREEQVLPGSGGRVLVGVSQTIYTHVSKCKNDEIKKNSLTSQKNDNE
jgi:hypothetical protein